MRICQGTAIEFKRQFRMFSQEIQLPIINYYKVSYEIHGIRPIKISINSSKITFDLNKLTDTIE